VVAIVPTGSTVTAYLSRPSGSKPSEPTDAAASTDETKPDETKPDATKPDTAKPDTAKPDETKPDETKPDETKPEPAVPAAASGDHVTPGLSEREDASSPGDEPAGWALQPESANAGASGAATPATTTAAATTAAASAAAAPAGWYADPSSRYDLRYWDGGQWTEHVSRGGQQFSDPPVA
jgi:outer membrane biosynthesis protein TonB